jgi:hypothetical protein
VLRHPAGAGEMGLPGATRTFGLLLRIDEQNDARDFLPVGARGLRVEQVRIRVACRWS